MMRQTMVQLTDQLIELLDDEAARAGISRSAVLRAAVQEHFERSGLAVRKVVDGYTRLPPATPDSWGSLEAALGTATRELSQRLDAEEKREGDQPW